MVIQRIQTVFLLIAFALMVAFFFTPLAVVSLTNLDVVITTQAISMEVNGETISLVSRMTILMSMMALSALMSFVAIFLYKNMKLQKRLCLYNVVVCLLCYYKIFTEVYKFTHAEDYVATHLSWATIWIPAAVIVLSVMSYRAISKDKELLESYNRIR